ncbi:dTDP-glucose pyrophosphorylase [Thaumarchaeota archaeon SCGC AB-539-E09]|nr:dTDP-glucose pyrophosphorylase [Thaumarchaeota archaeon SCGC AB-539-E09]
MKGVILAAGEGTRIKDITYGAIPKELLPIGNVPTIRFPLESMKLLGIDRMIVVIPPNGKQSLVQGLRSGQQFGVDICYVVQENNGPRGIGKAIEAAKNWVDEDDFVVACGDTILCNFLAHNPFDCLQPLKKVQYLNDPIASVILFPLSDGPERFGVAKFKNLDNDEGTLYGEIDVLIEKPSIEKAKELKSNGFYYVIAGYYLFSPRIFPYIEKTDPGKNNEVQITDAMILAMNNGEKVYGIVHGGNNGKQFLPYEYWDVGMPEAYKEANKKLIDIDLIEILRKVNGKCK